MRKRGINSVEDYLNPPDIEYSQGELTDEELEYLRLERIEKAIVDYKERI